MPYFFPPTAGLETAKSDTSEFLYNGSIGSNRIFHVLRTLAGISGNPKWDLYLINVYTLVRNAYTKGISQSELEKTLDKDVDLYMTFIGAYMSYLRTTPAVVLFYAPDYTGIPKDVLRTTSGQRDELDAMYSKILHKLPRKLTELTEDPLVRKFLIATNGSAFPHKEIPGYIRNIYGNTRNAGRLGTAIFTHCPIDLHLMTAIPKLELFESFTGAVYPSSEFGRKLTKEVKVPFNTVTHRAFGDDVHFEALIKNRRKTEMIEVAAKHNWAIRTEQEILSDILSYFPEVTQYRLLQLRL
jgi:hypothetical protein